MQSQTRKMAESAVLIGLAIIFSYIEILIPFNFGIPGMKLGLPNLVVIITLYWLGGAYALTINCVRILLVSFLFGNFSMALYSLAGALLSFGVMYLLKSTKAFSVIGVSMAGGAFHNVGQLAVAALVVENAKMLFLLPLLLIVGMVTGILMGIIASKLLNHKGWLMRN
ncbi:MAG: Gx transporter family protein [Anaerovorax sp.]